MLVFIRLSVRILTDESDLLIYSDNSSEYSNESDFDKDGLPDDVSTPLSVHDVYTDTEPELSLVEILSSDEC